MARCRAARWVGTPNFTCGGMAGQPNGLTFHRTAGLMPGCLCWMQNPKAQASAHFLNPKVGQLLQLVDTADKAWAQVAGNHNWISVEHEGVPGDGGPTQNQMQNDVVLIVAPGDRRDLSLAKGVVERVVDVLG